MQVAVSFLIGLLVLTCGCSTYDEKMSTVFEAYYSSNISTAATLADEALKDIGETDDDAPLYLLEKASVALAGGDCKTAIECMKQADDMSEVLDLTGNPEEVGKYLFSDSSGKYRMQPHEQIQMNVFNIVNHLLINDLSGANVEVKRAMSQQQYWMDVKGQTSDKNALLALLGFSVNYHLNKTGDISFFKNQLAEVFSSANELTKPLQENEKEILVIIYNGQAPVKKEMKEQIVGTDIVRIISHTGFTGDYIIYPGLETRRSPFSGAEVLIDGKLFGTCGNLLDIEGQAIARYNQQKNAILVAAATRMAIRAAASTAAAIATEEAVKKQSGSGYGALAGMLAGTITKSAMEAADRADTRCWTLLPKNVFATRIVNKFPNEVTLNVRLNGGHTISKKMTLKNKLNVAVFVLPSSHTVFFNTNAK